MQIKLAELSQGVCTEESTVQFGLGFKGSILGLS